MPGESSRLLLPHAAGNRHGLVFRPQTAVVSPSDIPGIVHVGVPFGASNGWKSAAGGVARNEVDAQLAAIGEGVERYCAAIADVPLRTLDTLPSELVLHARDWTLFSDSQRRQPTFPFANLYSTECRYTEVFDMETHAPKWVPHPLVVLRDDYETGIPTSSGLAAGATAAQALLRAIQEVIERDALMATWLHSLPGRSVPLGSDYVSEVTKRGGKVWAFDLTPDYSPFPVVAVAGGIPQRGVWRYSLGVACRETLAAATEKAYLEWCQGVFFAGVYPKYVNTKTIQSAQDVATFDDHAIYYSQHPNQWLQLPLLAKRDVMHAPQRMGKPLPPREAVRCVVRHLHRQGIRLYYRDLTTVDALQAGVRVVRVLSPHLIPINAHHAWPFLGGTAADVRRRYGWAPLATTFPNPFPHPLG